MKMVRAGAAKLGKGIHAGVLLILTHFPRTGGKLQEKLVP